MADALEGDDPGADLARLAAGVWGDRPRDAAGVQAFVQSFLASVLPQLQGVGAAVDEARADLDDLARQQAEYRDATSASESDPAIRRAIEALGDPQIIEALSGVLKDVDRAVATVTRALQGAARGTPGDAATLRKLERDLRDIEERTRAIDPTARLFEAFQALRERLEEADDPRSADMALMEAALRQARRQRDGTDGLDPAFEHALALAERHGVLPVAREAAQALQLQAVAADDMPRVAALAGRVVGVADADGEYRPRILSRLEVALALARAGQTTAGMEAADEARTLARDVGLTELAGRAGVVQGQILEQVGDARGALGLHRAVLRDLPDTDPSMKGARGRAWMGVGRCLAAGPERLDAWTRAQHLGVEIGDRLLFTQGSMGIVEHYLQAGDRVATVSALVRFRTAAKDMGGDEAALPFDRVAAGLEQEWGAEGFARAVEAFRASWKR